MSSLFSDIGNAIGYAASGPARGRASRQAGQAVQNYEDLNPQIGAAVIGDPYAAIKSNPNDVAAAQGALQDLQGVSHGTGLTAGDASALQAAQLSNAQQQGSALQGILNSAQRAGTLNGGRAIAGQLGAAQAAGNANAQAGAQAAANSGQERLNAMGQVGQLGQSLEGQQFGEQAAKAAGTTGVNEYNVNQNVNTQQLTAQNRLNQARGEQSALDTLIELNNQKGKDIQGAGSDIGGGLDSVVAAMRGKG